MVTISIQGRMETTVNYRFGLPVKIKLMQDDEFGRRCIGSDINWCNPHDFFRDSSWVPSWVVISSHTTMILTQHWNHLVLMKMMILTDSSGLKVLQNLGESHQNC